MQTINLGARSSVVSGGLAVSRFILGSNPFSGFSHQGSEMDLAMKHYYTTECIKHTLRQAEALGINSLVARTDHHVMRFLMEHWDEGGQLQWLAQTCPEVGDHRACVERAAGCSAKVCHIHGGVMDFLFAQGRMAEIPPVVEMIHDRGMLAGIAAHNPAVIRWAEENLDVDYYLCSYYNSARRDQRAEHVPGMKEWFWAEDRQTMTGLIQGLSRPAIHYKVMAAGRNDPREAFTWVARSLRPGDAVCVGVFTRGAPAMLREDVELLEEALAATANEGPTAALAGPTNK